MDTTLTALFFTNDLAKHATINFEKDVLPYKTFINLPSFNQTHILDKTDRWLNLHFHIEDMTQDRDKLHYFSITNPRSQGCPRFQSGEELANSVGKINAC